MGEKLYRPIMKDGEHLVDSRKTEGTVRGVAQDENNRNTDIVEWEEVDLDDFIYGYENSRSGYSEPEYNEPEPRELSPAEQELMNAISTLLVKVVEVGVAELHEHVIKPWWNKHGEPWVKNKIDLVREKFKKKKREDGTVRNNKADLKQDNVEVVSVSRVEKNSIIFDEKIFSEMSTEEVEEHLLKLIYYILGTAYEIKIISNTKIKNETQNQDEYIEKKELAEKILAAKVASSINELLSNKQLALDSPQSNQIFNLLGGGIRMEGEYVPVDLNKVYIALNSLPSDRPVENKEFINHEI